MRFCQDVVRWIKFGRVCRGDMCQASFACYCKSCGVGVCIGRRGLHQLV